MSEDTSIPNEFEDFLPFVEKWVQSGRRIDETFGKIESAFMASPENPIRKAIWGMFGEYTRVIAELISDDPNDAEEWINWFAWECDFGQKPLEMEFSNGEVLMVVGASDLLSAILTDEEGKRVYYAIDDESPRNEA